MALQEDVGNSMDGINKQRINFEENINKKTLIHKDTLNHKETVEMRKENLEILTLTRWTEEGCGPPTRRVCMNG